MRVLYPNRQRYCYSGKRWHLMSRCCKGDRLGQRRLISNSPRPTNGGSDSQQATKVQDDPVSSAKAAGEHRPLPLPPMMDPVKLAARNKYRTAKRLPDGQNLTPLQRELKNNPYAHALATPIRYCDYTNMRLPNFFLLGFELVAHPKTGAPWLVPSNLALPTEPPRSKSGTDSDPNAGQDAVHDSSRNLTSPNRLPTPPASPGSYVAAKDFIFHRLTKEGQITRKSKGWSRVINPRMYQRYPLQGKEIQWPKNMDELVLRLLRLRAIRELAYLANRTETGYVKSGREGLSGATSKYQVGCMLWLGPSNSPSSPAQDTRIEDQRGKENFQWDPITGPAPYATVTADGWAKRRVIVYNLPQLLGTDLLAKLREQLGRHRDEEVLVLKSKWAVVRAQTWLWKLQGFLTAPREVGA